MAPHRLLYQLLLGALGLMCLLGHVGWPDHPTPTPRTALKPSKPRRKRSTEPKPFTGYIHQPLCAACEQGADWRPKAPGSPPPVRIVTRGRRRTVDPAGHCCPDQDGAYRGWPDRGTIRAPGPPGGQPGRQLQWVSCGGSFYETAGTILHGKRAAPELLGHVIAWLAAGVGLQGAARVGEIDANTVRNWLGEAAEQLHALSAYFLHALPLKHMPRDERSAVRRAGRDGARSAAEAIEQRARRTGCGRRSSPRAHCCCVVKRVPEPGRGLKRCGIKSFRCWRPGVGRCC